MTLDFLDDSGIDQQYVLKKDLLIHTILKPVLTMYDSSKNVSVQIYSGHKTGDLTEQYDKVDVKKLDGIYNKMIFSKVVFLVQLVQDTDIQLAQKAGYMHDAVFSVFKDELLKASPAFMLSLTSLDPKTYLQENLN